jgi:hypothetical protein
MRVADLDANQHHLHDYLVGVTRDMVQRGIMRHASGEPLLATCFGELEKVIKRLGKDMAAVGKVAGTGIKTTGEDLATRLKSSLVDAAVGGLAEFLTGKRR